MSLNDASILVKSFDCDKDCVVKGKGSNIQPDGVKDIDGPNTLLQDEKKSTNVLQDNLSNTIVSLQQGRINTGQEQINCNISPDKIEKVVNCSNTYSKMSVLDTGTNHHKTVADG